MSISMGLKAANDGKGHGAGDGLRKRVVGALQARLRSFEPIIRLGGDELLCALSGARIENARRRFDTRSPRSSPPRPMAAR
jgi:GGDEF domain-containing protein